MLSYDHLKLSDQTQAAKLDCCSLVALSCRFLAEEPSLRIESQDGALDDVDSTPCWWHTRPRSLFVSAAAWGMFLFLLH